MDRLRISTGAERFPPLSATDIIMVPLLEKCEGVDVICILKTRFYWGKR